MLRVACLPTWGAVAIDDIYSQANKATRIYNLHVLIGSKVIVNYPKLNLLESKSVSRNTCSNSGRAWFMV